MPLAAAVIASASAASAATQIQRAAAAPTVEAEDFCVDASTYAVCAGDDGSNPVEMVVTSFPTIWNWPDGGKGEITVYGTDDCMQVDHDDSNHVIVATCTGASYQEWNIVNDVSATGYYQFQTEWDPALCLAYDHDGNNAWVVSCGSTDWYEHWVGD
jgi:hypothetical protein